MKKTLLVAVICMVAYFSAHAQTKGTNALGAGFSSTSYKQESGNFKTEDKGTSFNLGYGRFIKDNLKLGVNGTYSHCTSRYSSNNDSTEVNKFGGGISLQKYFPLFNNFMLMPAVIHTMPPQSKQQIGLQIITLMRIHTSSEPPVG